MDLLLQDQESASTTAKSIAQVYEPSLKAGDSERALTGLWNIISGAATEFSDEQAERLAHLIIELHNLPDCRNVNDQVLTVGRLVVWRDLPYWAAAFREWSIPFDTIYHTKDDGSAVTIHESNGDQLTAQQLLNATTFAAHVLAGLPAGAFDDCGAMPSYASIALEMALELSHGSETDEIEIWRMLVLPAATWILVAGEKLHQLSHLTPPEASQYFVTHREWPSTFCKERWLFWKQQLHQLREPLGLEKSSQGMASRAEARMNELDGL